VRERERDVDWLRVCEFIEGIEFDNTFPQSVTPPTHTRTPYLNEKSTREGGGEGGREGGRERTVAKVHDVSPLTTHLQNGFCSLLDDVIRP
jgi:hypothetical protein